MGYTIDLAILDYNLFFKGRIFAPTQTRTRKDID